MALHVLGRKLFIFYKTIIMKGEALGIGSTVWLDVMILEIHI